MKKKLLVLLSSLLISSNAFSGTLEEVINRGELVCGIHGSLHGMSYISKNDNFVGFDVDFCKAVASAVLGDTDAIDFVTLTSKIRFKALENKEIDLLARNSTWNYSRDTKGLEFVGTSFYDGQSFLVKANKGITTPSDIKPGMSVCSVKGTSTTENLYAFSEKNNLSLKISEDLSKSASELSFFSGKCDLYSSDTTALLSIRELSATDPKEYIIMDKPISKEPLSPAVRDNDPQWANIVRWALFALIEAEEKGITSKNVDSFSKTADKQTRFMLGIDAGIGKGVGLDDKWAYRIIKNVGNYGEIYERNFGENSKTPIERGLNALWKNGGILYSPPLN